MNDNDGMAIRSVPNGKHEVLLAEPIMCTRGISTTNLWDVSMILLTVEAHQQISYSWIPLLLLQA